MEMYQMTHASALLSRCRFR